MFSRYVISLCLHIGARERLFRRTPLRRGLARRSHAMPGYVPAESAPFLVHQASCDLLHSLMYRLVECFLARSGRAHSAYPVVDHFLVRVGLRLLLDGGADFADLRVRQVAMDLADLGLETITELLQLDLLFLESQIGMGDEFHGLDEGESFLLDLGDGRLLEEGMGQHGVGSHEEHGVLAELVQLGLLLFVRQRVVVLDLLRSLDELGLLLAELRLLLMAGAVVLRHFILGLCWSSCRSDGDKHRQNGEYDPRIHLLSYPRLIFPLTMFDFKQDKPSYSSRPR